MKFPKPCLECGTITNTGSYCPKHQAIRDEAEKLRQTLRKRNRTLYTSPAYRKQAKLIRDTATHCHICGGTYRLNDPWTADHLIPGDPNSPLAPAHRSCNSRRGNKPL